MSFKYQNMRFTKNYVLLIKACFLSIVINKSL